MIQAQAAVALVLAAGRGTRFGADKLSAPFCGEPLIRHAIRAARAAPVERVIAICGERLDIGEWPGAPVVDTLRIASPALSVSLKAGIAAAGDAERVFVFLGDMPLIPHGVAGDLAEAMGDGFAAVPQHDGRPGHPVLLSRRAFTEIAALTGDQGAGVLLRSRSDVARIAVDDPAILIDVDHAEDLVRLEIGQAR